MGLTERIIGAGIRIHREFGPGLLESIYEAALALELEREGLRCRRQVPVSIRWQGEELGVGLRADLIVQEQVLVEVKAVESLEPVHSRQALTYLRATGLTTGLLLNFGAPTLRQGIIRLIHSSP